MTSRPLHTLIAVTFTAALIAAVFAVRPAPAPPSPVNFAVLDRDRDLHGTVVDETGAPLADAVIASALQLRGVCDSMQRELPETSPGPSARSAADGSFALRLTPGDLATLTVSAPARATVRLKRLNAGERVRVTLMRAASLVVRATDEAGAPVSGLRFVAGTPRDEDLDFRSEGVTDPDGRVVLDGLPPASDLSLRAEGASGARLRPLRVRLPLDGELPVIVPSLAAEPGVDGRVAYELSGAAVIGARVRWRSSDDDAGVAVDEEGRFELPGLDEFSSRTVEVILPDGARYTASARNAERIEIPPGVRVEGSVFGPDGSPAPGATVFACQEGRAAPSLSREATVTDARGRFTLTRLSLRNSYTLRVLVPGLGTVSRTVTPFVPVVDLGRIDCASSNTLRGRFLSADGTPLPRAEVSMSAVDTDRPSPRRRYLRTWTRRTDDLGRFRADGLPAGHYALTARADGVPFCWPEVDVPRDSEFVIRVERTRVLRVRVEDDAGAPIARVGLFALPTRGRALTRGSTGIDGESRLLVLEGVPVRVSVRGDFPSAHLSPRSVEVAADTNAVTLVAPRARGISGRVLDGSGAPVPWARGAAHQDGIGDNTFTADAEGRFRVTVAHDRPSTLEFGGLTCAPDDVRAELPLRARLSGVAPGATEVELKCAGADRSLIVHVVRHDGRSMARVEVRIAAAGDADTRVVRTDRDGIAELTDLPAGELELSVRDDWLHAWVAPELVRTPADGGVVTFRYAPAQRVQGDVRIVGGGDLDGLEVRARTAAGRVSVVPVDRTGTFQLLVPADASGALELTVVGRELVDGPVRFVPQRHRTARLVVKTE